VSRFITKQSIAAWAILSLAALTSGDTPADDAPLKLANPAPSIGPTATGGHETTAVLMPYRKAALSSEISGRITAVHFEFGQRFQTGDVLVAMDDTVARAAVGAAEARLDWAMANQQRVEQLIARQTTVRRARAIVDAARTRFNAIEALYADADASEVQLAEARRDLEAARSELEATEASQATSLAEAQRELALAQGQLASARRQLAGCRVIAPFAGRVAALHVHEHEQVAPGDRIVDLVCDQPLLARFLLPDHLFHQVQAGDTIELHIDGVEQPLKATVSHIAAVIEPASRTFEVRTLLNNEDRQLRAGMTGSVAVEQFGGDR
jgi:HlyD family secretion protein